MKIIIDIPKEAYEYVKATSYLGWLTTGEYAYVIQNGTPLDDVKAEIKAEMNNLADTQDWGRYYGLGIAHRILANIGKAESEDKE